MRRLSISLLNKSRTTSFNGTTGRRIEPVQGNLVPTLSPDVSGNTPNLRIRLCPTLHRLMTLCWQLPLSGHTGMRFPWSMSLSWNDFHLAPKMLLLDALMRQDLTS